jgi:hypothetical protein
MRTSEIVAGPGWVYSGTARCRGVRSRLLAEARLRHQAELSEAPLWRRLGLELILRQRVRAETRRMFPADALYAFRGTR